MMIEKSFILAYFFAMKRAKICHEKCKATTKLESWVDKNDVEYLINVFHDAKEYGSILNVNPVNFDAIEKRLEEIRSGETLDIFELQQKNIILDKIPPLVKQAKIMSQKYDVVVTNPPYLGRKGMNNKLIKFADRVYQDSKTDLFAIFTEVTINYLKNFRFLGIINQHSWMFLKSFVSLRKRIINNTEIYSMLHLGPKAFEEISGEVVQSTTFITRKNNIKNYIGTYIRLTDLNSSKEKESGMLYAKDNDVSYKFSAKSNVFEKIPGTPTTYWINKSVIKIFSLGYKLGSLASQKTRISTGDNDRFLKLWYEISSEKMSKINDRQNSNYQELIKWFPCNKGGTFRKWYGNNEYVINYANNGKDLKEFKGYQKGDEKFYFVRGLTWSVITSGDISFRLSPDGFLSDHKGPLLYIYDYEKYCLYLLGLLNSKVSQYFLDILSPTLSYEWGTISNIPLVQKENFSNKDYIDSISEKNIKISKNNWDYFETSWDFQRHPTLTYKQGANTIEQSFNNWSQFAQKQFAQLKSNEEELNRIFIDIYGLQGELIPEEDDKDVTVRKADRARDIKSFISYAVGCMFGRYSIDADGLIYAGGEWKDKWRVENGQGKVRKIVKDNDGNIVENTWVDASFVPDEDNIIPITDDEYFSDDIVSRFVEFAQVTFGEETLEENLDYIAETIGRKSSETSRQAIRRYFIKDFYKDHIQIYQKRPIYWLFDSGKNDGFKVLIYMHRYDEFTVSRVRTDYLHKLQHMYEAEYNRLDIVIDSDTSEREKANARKEKEKLQKQMAECLQYDQVIAHVANQRIDIDLDDGVKVNYEKFQDIEVPQGEGRKPVKADLLAKI